jgi:gamma-glutamyltranspeptidase/glutathione hydrolase
VNADVLTNRPQSSIASSIAEDLETGDFIMATGSAGGSRIITATLQELYHHIDQGLNGRQSFRDVAAVQQLTSIVVSASQCVHQSRWHDQLSGQTYFELPAPDLGISGFDNGTVSYLAQQGYNITYQGETGSTSHVIIKMRNGLYEAASDPRKVS